MKLYYSDIPQEVRERAVSLYVDKKLSLKEVSDALGLTRSIVRKIILESGHMRPSRMHSRDIVFDINESLSEQDAAYVAGVYDSDGKVYPVNGNSVRYVLMITSREKTLERVKSIMIAGSITKDGTLYRISKQVEIASFCEAIAPFSVNSRHLLHTAERIRDANGRNKKEEA